MKVTLVNLIFLYLMFFILCHHRLKVVEQTFWQKVMKEVLKYLGLEFRGCCHDKGVLNTQRCPYYDLTTNIYPRMFGIEPFFLIFVHAWLAHVKGWVSSS